MHSAGGTLDGRSVQIRGPPVLSGPAGGVIGAAFVAQTAGFADVITYDMGGTSTDVATSWMAARSGRRASPSTACRWRLPMFDIHTVGAGGGVDRLPGRRRGSASARNRRAPSGARVLRPGGIEPTVTDANVVLGRILPDRFYRRR